MKNKLSAIVLSIAIVSSILLFVIKTSGSSDGYSSADDPLITLSYVSEVIVPQLEQKITQKILASLPASSPDPNGGIEGSSADQTLVFDAQGNAIGSVSLSMLKYKVLVLKNGQKLMAAGTNTDSLEFILRAGSASVLSPFADQGIGDITAGKELQNEEPLTKNNYCVVPRGNDGRGILVTSDELYILVRGEYEILE